VGPTNPQRADELELNEVADGYVVYQPSRDRVHYVNHTAALVLELCTGANSVDEIERAIQVAYDLPEVPKDELDACFAKFYTEGLIL
jgi:hypothetical protein